MTDAIAPAAPVVKAAPKKVKVVNPLFSMTFWADEQLARKSIKENFQIIAQNADDAGIKCHFHRTKDNGDGTQTLEIQFAETREVTKKDGSKETIHEFSGNDYLRLTYDPNRKFPRSEKREEGENKKAKGSLPSFVTNRPNNRMIND